MAGTLHLSVQEKMIYALANDEGWSGDVCAPNGAFVSFWLDAKERNLIAAATDVDFGDVPKYWIVREDDQGFLYFDSFESPADHVAQDNRLEAEYAAWDE